MTVVSSTLMGLSGPPIAAQTVGDPVFVGAGDISDCSNTADAATANLLDTIAGTVYTTGDLAYPDGRAIDFQNCYEPTWGRHKARTRPSPGNHEYHTAGAAPYFAYFGANAGPAGLGYYSYDLGAWHIVSLNSEIAVGAGSTQEQWLRADLAAHPNTCTLAYWHRPRFNSGSTHGSDGNMSALWQALYERGVDLVLNGHEHLYERFAPQNPNGQADPGRGIRQFTVGTGGRGFYSFGTPLPNSQVRNASTHGVLKLALHATSYDWQFVPVAGSSFTDTGTDTCVNAAPAATNTPTVPTATSSPTAVVTPSTPTPTSIASATPTSPAATNTPVLPTATSTAVGTPTTVTRTLQTADGWDTKLQKLLSQDGKLYTLLSSDNVWWEIEATYYTSLRFQQSVPANATIQSVKIHVEHHEEQGIAPSTAALWQVGGGSIRNPTTLASFQAPIRQGEALETTVVWDVSAAINTPDRVNDLKLRLRNNATNGKKSKIDRAWVVVTYTQ